MSADVACVLRFRLYNGPQGEPGSDTLRALRCSVSSTGLLTLPGRWPGLKDRA